MPQLTLLKPLITEKGMRLAQAGQFSFAVAVNASKPAIARAVEEQFNVRVIQVATSRIRSKAKRTGRRRLLRSGQTMKKAMVTLKPGQTIELFRLPEKKTQKGKKVKK